MRCSRCEFDNPAGMKFCGNCRNPLGLICPRCHFENPPGFTFCGQCTGRLAAVEKKGGPAVQLDAAAVEDASLAVGERKIVSVLFADLKGSTTLMEDLDPEAAHAIVAPLLRIMAEVTQRYEGYVARTTGDGIFALFGAPVAYEDHPQRALYAALEMQRELRAEGQRRTAKGLRALEARVGVHTGEVVAYSVETSGKVEYRLVGHTANLAARLEALAPVGSIATSEDTRKLCEGYFDLRELGPTTVKGLSAPIDVYEVIGLSALRTHFQVAARRGLTKFVGRQHELGQMQRALELAVDGHGQVVAVMAEAGTGKSRLFHEFKATIPATCRVLEAYSVSHGKASAWLPVLELLCGYFGLEDTDDAASRRAKVRAVLTALDPALEDTLPYLFGLLGIVEGPDPLAQMDPQIKRRRVLDAMKRVIFRESLNQSLVVIFEDLHWIDAQTKALLDLLADSSGSTRVLLLVNYRPEFRHEWGNKSHYVQLGLNPLGRESAEELLAALLEDAVELRPLKRLIIERTGGNPFFIEEMVQALFDERILVRNGLVKVTRSLSQIHVPPTVQGILAARIDGLSGEQKELLQTLAVIGKESRLGLIRKVASASVNARLESILADLRASEFIYEQPALADSEYIFKHALTQEVAYNSLLIERRKQFHDRAGQAIESIFKGQLDEHLTQLAHHYSHSDNLDKAIEYLGRAGQQGLQRSAHAEAISDLNAAIALLQTLPDSPESIQRELPLQLALGSASIPVKGWAALEVERAFTRARGLCERLGDPPELFPALFGLWTMYFIRAELRTAHELGELLLRRAQEARRPALLLLAHQALGDTLFNMGELLLASEHLEMAISLYDSERHRPRGFRHGGVDAKVNCLLYAARTLWTLGYPDRALERGNECIALAHALAHPHTLAFAEDALGRLHLWRREARAAQGATERLLALSTEHGFNFWLAVASILHGSAISEQGRNEEGIAQIQEGLVTLRRTGAENGRPQYLTLLAEACMKTGRLDDGLNALTEALAAAEENENRHYEAETHRIKGELLLRHGDANASEAQNCFQRAIDIARKQSAKSWELRATTSLVRLLASQGNRDEARAMLAEIYDWFTEGFDTADLKDAKTLLDELSG
jgi:predicted ATPase/class 3 adenylate cyclase